MDTVKGTPTYWKKNYFLGFSHREIIRPPNTFYEFR